METNKTVEKIANMLDERGWTLYRLAMESGLSYSSINNLFKRNTEPTLPTLRSICKGLGVSMSEFFSDEPAPVRFECSAAEQKIITEYRSLNAKDKKLITTYLSGLNKKLPSDQEN